MPRLVALIALTIGCTTAGNLLLKIGASRPPAAPIWPLALLSVPTIAGAMAFGIGLLLYATVLKDLALNLAQSVFALQFIGVIVASAVLLGEPIAFTRWVGMAIIVFGVAIVIYSART